MSNYPPGVSGNEYEIAGADYERDYKGECPECHADNALMEQGYGYQRWVTCSECEHSWDLPEAPAPGGR